jgi:hypothetical protein
MVLLRIRKLLAFGPCVCVLVCDVSCKGGSHRKEHKTPLSENHSGLSLANIYFLQHLIPCKCMISKSELLIHFIGYPPTSRSGSAL